MGTTTDPQFLTASDVDHIAESIQYRQTRWPSETFVMSVGVVLMNYGSKHVRVHCINGEWSGTKGDLPPGTGIPTCPNGHVMVETTEAPRLALVAQP